MSSACLLKTCLGRCSWLQQSIILLGWGLQGRYSSGEITTCQADKVALQAWASSTPGGPIHVPMVAVISVPLSVYVRVLDKQIHCWLGCNWSLSTSLGLSILHLNTCSMSVCVCVSNTVGLFDWSEDYFPLLCHIVLGLFVFTFLLTWAKLFSHISRPCLICPCESKWLDCRCMLTTASNSLSCRFCVGSYYIVALSVLS